jgi:hypothetical protein
MARITGTWLCSAFHSEWTLLLHPWSLFICIRASSSLFCNNRFHSVLNHTNDYAVISSVNYPFSHPVPLQLLLHFSASLYSKSQKIFSRRYFQFLFSHSLKLTSSGCFPFPIQWKSH